jgi:hypothetical protein
VSKEEPPNSASLNDLKAAGRCPENRPQSSHRRADVGVHEGHSREIQFRITGWREISAWPQTSVEAQVCHATHVKEGALANSYKTKEYVLASGAPSHNAGTLHVQMRLGKALDCAAVRTLSLSNRNIHREDFAQFTGSGVAVKIVKVI